MARLVYSFHRWPSSQVKLVTVAHGDVKKSAGKQSQALCEIYNMNADYQCVQASWSDQRLHKNRCQRWKK